MMTGAGKVTGTASAPKHTLLKSLGFDELIDYKMSDYVTLYSSSRPFDVALDQTSEGTRLCQVVKEGGCIVSAVEGFSGDDLANAGIPVNPILRFALYMMRWSLLSKAKAAKVRHSGLFLTPNAADLDTLSAMVEKGQLKAIVEDNVFVGIDKSHEAFAKLESGRVTGKVIVKIA
jgi:NADPH:quinone reductase-like Zn-dependent oxidoreductase